MFRTVKSSLVILAPTAVVILSLAGGRSYGP